MRLTTQSAAAGLLEAVEGLRPVITAGARRAEADCRLPIEVFQAMFDAGMFGMLVPRAYGGLEVHPVEAMEVWESVARIDSAAAWNLVMNQGVAGLAAWLPEDGVREVFDEGPTTVAGAFHPPGTAIAMPGGWRVSARVPFVSGCDNASWVVVPAIETVRGEWRLDPATSQPVLLGVFLRKEEAEILPGTWNTLGMRGTGSNDVAVDDVFVPSRRTLRVGPLTHPAPGFDGPLYRLFPWPAILGEATVSVGVAASAADGLFRLARSKTAAYNATPLREQQLAQHAAGRAQARINAARDTLRAAARDAYDDAATGSLLSWTTKTRLQLAVAFAAETCAEAVRLVHDTAGASAIRIGGCFERHFRDAHVLTQHTSKANPRYASAGRLLFGLENNWPWLAF